MKSPHPNHIGQVLLFMSAVLLFGSPRTSAQTPRGVSPSPHSLQQGADPWDANLVLPDKSSRIANYTMNVSLDAERHRIAGTELLQWKNTTGLPQSVFPFHLYHNAWKNNRSTYSREQGWSLGRPDMEDDDYGYTNVQRIEYLNGARSLDITSSLRYVQPDDGNPYDRTVFEITTPEAIRPGEVLRLRVTFETQQPVPLDRTGHIRNYHFVAQWFPKIGVFWKGAWNCHQFHVNSEFFADYGVYDVSITIPSSFIIGATGGNARDVTVHPDGTTTHRFVQEDVHDFAWLASPDLVVTRRTFSHAKPDPHERPDRHHPLREVEVIVITQPHHSNMIDRYFDATFKALRYYGEWYGQYPYSTVTVVDPANGSRSGGMEYPTLFTGGSSMFSPTRVPRPESVTVHEFGHQFWYGLVGNNEFEEAWLDEGFNTYSQDRVLMHGWSNTPFRYDESPWRTAAYYFGGTGAGTSVGVPYVFDDMPVLRLLTGNSQIRTSGKNDPMARRSWEYLGTYGLNSYTKPALTLHTLERYVGEEMMYRIMRTYHHRFRFRHPTSKDFVATVNEVTGKDMSWFFDQTWFSSDVFDYELYSIANTRIPEARGHFSATGTRTVPDEPTSAAYKSEIVVKRLGEAIAPVDVLITFRDGSTNLVPWDGAERWTRISFDTDIPVVSAIVDPYRKLLLDINWTNNSMVVRQGLSLAALRWGARFLFWVQSYLNMTTHW